MSKNKPNCRADNQNIKFVLSEIKTFYYALICATCMTPVLINRSRY